MEMSEPDKKKARQANFSVLDMDVWFARADRRYLNQLLGEFWGKSGNPSKELIFCLTNESSPPQIEGDADQIAAALGEELTRFVSYGKNEEMICDLFSEIETG